MDTYTTESVDNEPNYAEDISDDEVYTPVSYYTRPRLILWLRSMAINMFLPFVNGVMLGFGEIMAHEIAFRVGWRGSRVFPDTQRRRVGPGVEIQSDPSRNDMRPHLISDNAVFMH